MRRAGDRQLPVILPDADSDDLQDAYRCVSDLVSAYNRCHASQMVSVQFDVVGGEYGGCQRDYRGCYVARDRCDLGA